MQDNYNKELENRGWEAMSAILDAEMPEKNKRRRTYLLLLIPLILLVGAWSTYYIWTNNNIKSNIDYASNNTDIEINSKKEETFLSTNEFKKEETKKDIVVNQAERNNSNDVSNRDIIGEDNIVAAKTSFSKKREQVTETKTAKRLTIPSNSAIETISSDEKHAEREAVLSDIAYEEDVVDVDEYSKVEANGHRVEYSDLDKLAGIIIPTFQYKKEVVLPAKITKARNRSSIFGYAEASSGVTIQEGNLVAGAGLGVGRKMSNRWSLAIGANYYTTSFDNSIAFRNQLDSEFVDIDINQEDPNGSLATNEQVLRAVTGINALSVPLEAQYKLSRRWNLGLGLEYQYIQKVYVRENPSLSNVADPSSPSVSGFEVDAEVIKARTRKHNLGVVPSLYYNASNRVQLFVRGNFLAYSILDNGLGNANKNISNATLGLRYNL